MVGVVAEAEGATASKVGFIPQAANTCCNNTPPAPRPAIFSKSRRDIRFIVSPFRDRKLVLLQIKLAAIKFHGNTDTLNF
jgi:hypothetical protein